MAQNVTRPARPQRRWWRWWLSNLLWITVLIVAAFYSLKSYSSLARETDKFAAVRDAKAREVDQLKEYLSFLQKEREALESPDPIIIEKEARKQLHYARPGEIPYRRGKFRFLFDPEEIVANYLDSTTSQTTPPAQNLLDIEIEEWKMPTVVCSTVLVTLLFFYDPKKR